MRPSSVPTLLCLFLLCLRTSCFADWGFPEDEDVVMLDMFSHDRFIKEFPEVMIHYHIDDCKHCHDLKPIYSKLALEFKERKRRIPLAQFDCSEHRSFCHDKMIPVYPYLKFFVKEHPLLYNGKRTYDALKVYLEYMADRQPDRTTVASFVGLIDHYYSPEELDPSLYEAEELAAEVQARNENRNKVIGVYFGRKNKNKKLFKIFDLYFKYDKNTHFLHIKKLPELNTSNLKIFGDVMADEPNFNGKVILFYRDRSSVFKGKSTFDALEHAVHELKYPRLNYMDPEIYNSLLSKRHTFVFLFCTTSDHWSVRQLSRLANQYRRAYTFVIVPDDSEHTEVVNKVKKRFLYLGKDEFDLEENPQMRVVQMNYSFVTAKKFILSGLFSYDEGLRFLIDFKAKKLHPFFRSEKLAEETYEGSRLRHLNASNYAESIRVPGQVSLVLYHDGFEFNPQTKLFLSYMIELSNDPIFKNLEFFLVDATKNEIPDFYDNERPVLLCYSPRNLHSPLIYNKAFNKFRIVKMISKAKTVKTPQEQLEKVVFRKQAN